MKETIKEENRIDRNTNRGRGFAKLVCPMCGTRKIETRGEGVSTVWVCQECPCVIFEYYDANSIKRLIQALGRTTMEPTKEQYDAIARQLEKKTCHNHTGCFK